MLELNFWKTCRKWGLLFERLGFFLKWARLRSLTKLSWLGASEDLGSHLNFEMPIVPCCQTTTGSGCASSPSLAVLFPVRPLRHPADGATFERLGVGLENPWRCLYFRSWFKQLQFVLLFTYRHMKKKGASSSLQVIEDECLCKRHLLPNFAGLDSSSGHSDLDIVEKI